MKPQDGLIHHPRHQKHLLYLFLLGNATKLVVQGDSDFRLQELLLLLGGCHILSVSKLIGAVKLCNIDFDMQF